MKKKLVIILLLGIFLISLVSAAEWDNTYTYNPETRTALIENAFGLPLIGQDLAIVTLTSPQNVRVARGIDRLVGEFNLTTTGDFMDVFGEMYLTDMKNGNEISRGKQYKYKKYKNVSVDDYETVCENITTGNGTVEECEIIEVGSHWEIQTDWIPVGNPTNTFYSGVTYEIGVFVDVEKGDHGDWRPEILGVEIPEWAEWTEDLNVGLKAYYKLDEPSGTNVVDSTGVFNGTLSGASIDVNQPGLISTAYKGDTEDASKVDLPFDMIASHAEFTVSIWINYTGTSVFVTPVGNKLSGSDATAATGGTGLNDGNWHHVVAIRDGTTVGIFIDGTFIENQTGAFSSWSIWCNFPLAGECSMRTQAGSAGTNTQLFQWTSAGTKAMIGSLDEVGFWTRVLSPSEVTQLYNGGAGITWTDQFGNAPSVTLTSPANDSNLTSDTIDFITTVTDDIKVENVSLLLDGIINQTNTSGFNGSYTFTQTVDEGVHNWSILAYNNISLFNQSETRTFNYTQPPIDIQLNNPADAFVSEIALVNMSCSAMDPIGVEQLNLTINGIVNETLLNSSIAQNLTINKEISFDEGIYIWGCQALNAITSASSANRTLNVTYSLPVVTLLLPEDDSNTTIEFVPFTANVTDVNGIDNVSLFLNGVLNETNISGVQGDYLFNKTLDEGFYNWSIQANSILGKQTNSSNRSLIVHLTSPNATIIAPSGIVPYHLLGDNLTLNYSFTEPGQNLSEHLEECWYDYGERTDSLNQSDIPTPYVQSTYSFTYDNSVNHAGLLITWQSTYDGPFDTTELFSLNNCATNLINATSYCSGLLGITCDNNFTCGAITVASIPTASNAIFQDKNIGSIIQFNGISYNNSLNCTANTTSFEYVSGQNSISIFTIDSFGFTANDTSSWNFTLLEINQTFINETTEGNLQNISALVKLLAGETISAAILNYNGQLFAGVSSTSGENTVILKSELVTPNVETDQNVTFHWSIVLSGGEVINLSEQNQSVLSIGIDNCSTFTNKILNITMVDEEMQTPLSNTTIEIALDFLSIDRSTTIITFSQQFDNENPISICINTNITANIRYSLDSIIRYTADGYANEYYNIVNTELTNETGTINLTLYSLNESDSTEFQLTFKGSDFLPEEDVLVFVERQYISEDTFKTVELPKTDSNGQTVLHLVRNSVIYNMKFVKDDEVLRIFNNVIAFCQDFTVGNCVLSLNAVSNESGIFNYDESVGILYNSVPQYNETSKVVSFDFVSSDGITKLVSMEVERRDIFGNISVCSNTILSSSGTLSCSIGQDIDDTTLLTFISVDGNKWLTFTTQVDTTAYGGVGYVFWFFLTLILILMFGESKNGVMIALILSYIGAVSLGVSIGGLVGIGSAGIWAMVITIAGIWKINKDRKN